MTVDRRRRRLEACIRTVQAGIVNFADQHGHWTVYPSMQAMALSIEYNVARCYMQEQLSVTCMGSSCNQKGSPCWHRKWLPQAPLGLPVNLGTRPMWYIVCMMTTEQVPKRCKPQHERRMPCLYIFSAIT